MRIKLLTFALLVVLLGSPAPIGAQSRIRSWELDRMPLFAPPLKITLIQFRTSFMRIGWGSVELQVENTAGGEFATFFPQKLSFVGSDNNQVDILAIQSGEHYWPAVERRVAPAARIKEYYALNGKVHLPARAYYGDKLLVVITE